MEGEAIRGEKSSEAKTMAVAGGLAEGLQGGETEEKERDYTEDRLRSRIKRECPVPKPGRIVGEVLGFRIVKTKEETKGSKPP